MAKSPTWTVKSSLEALKKAGSKKVADGHARYGIVAAKSFGVPMGAIQAIGKRIGRDHGLAQGLWASGWYEARMLAAYVAEVDKVTSAEMDAWAADFDSWAVCDTLCFALWDRTPLVWTKIDAWATRDEEFVKRAAFALMAGVSLHDKGPIEVELLARLPLCAAAAKDARNFVKKGVSWALRTVGVRDAACHAKVTALAAKLAASTDRTERWIGSDVARDLARPLVAKKLAAKAANATKKKPARAR